MLLGHFEIHSNNVVTEAAQTVSCKGSLSKVSQLGSWGTERVLSAFSSYNLGWRPLEENCFPRLLSRFPAACLSFQVGFLISEASLPSECVLLQVSPNTCRTDEANRRLALCVGPMRSCLCGKNGRHQEPLFLNCSLTTGPEVALLAYVKIQVANLGRCGKIMMAAQPLLCTKLKMRVLESQ